MGHEGQEYSLWVLELQPERHTSIMDTDVEADVGPSMETEEAVRQVHAPLRPLVLRHGNAGCCLGGGSLVFVFLRAS